LLKLFQPEVVKYSVIYERVVALKSGQLL
jgi:hypothetical protein